ncbi:MAG: 2-oxo acid dehydrogenase subunit E2 [Pirellulaceae bacterium]
MATEFKLPELGEGVGSADVSRIYVSEGDAIEAEQNVMELETEKAVADLPCPHAGKVTNVQVSEGDTIKVGQTLLTIEENTAESEEESDGDQPQQEDVDAKDREESDKDEAEQRSAEEDDEKPAKPDEESEIEEQSDQQLKEKVGTEAAAETERQRDDTATEDKAHEESEKEDERAEGESAAAVNRGAGDGMRRPPPAGPATRRLARKLDVDLDDFQPPDGDRIRTEDVVRAYVESGKAAALTTEPLPDFTRFGPVEREPLNKIAKTAARRLSASWRTIPHVTQHGLADITQLESARRQHLEQAGDAAPKITLTSIAVKSSAGLLKEFPKFNASLDAESDELVLKKHYHIGVAVDTDHGLLVPVIRDADRKSIEQIAFELRAVADKARRRQLGKEDFEGGTFTISNQGGIGGGEFTPIVNYPEVAILGMGRARAELRMIEGQPAERLMLPLSVSYDHRVINGADAARFMDRLSRILADEFTLLIAM